MKMCGFGGACIWGILFILFGLSIIFHFPFFRIAFAILFIYIGLTMLVGRSGWNYCERWSTRIIGDNGSNEYTIMFGTGLVDLSSVIIDKGSVTKKVNVIFGKGTIKLNPAMPVRVNLESAFGHAAMPDGNQISFGDYHYETPSYNADANVLKVEANVVFGKLSVVAANPAI